MERQTGFSLLELGMALAIAAVFALYAGSSWLYLQQQIKLHSAVSAWRAALTTARSDAVMHNTPVTLCPSSNGLSCAPSADYHEGWIVLRKNQVVLDQAPLAGVRSSASNLSRKNIQFNPTGLPVGNFFGITVNFVAGDYKHCLVLARTGRIRDENCN